MSRCWRVAATPALRCNKNGVPVRKDLPTHDMTGGNYWMPDVIQYLDGQGKLVLGGGLSGGEIAGMDAGALRAIAPPPSRWTGA